MNSDDISNKLERAYHSMVSAIEHLVDKEERNLKEAVDIAEKTLLQWEDLSREEVEKISEEVKHDLSKLNETFVEARDAYRDQLTLDTLYLKERSMEKLSQIANKATLDFINFNKVLNEKSNIVTEEHYQQEHNEHQQWSSEHAMWLQDIAEWQKEHKKVQEQLPVLQEGIRQHGVMLEKHARVIQNHQRKEQQHEEVLAAVVQGQDIGEKLTKTEHNHEQNQHTHRKQAKLHEKIKQEHKEVMVLVAKLHKHLNV